MTTITFPTNTTEIIDKIRGAIGRIVNIYYTVSGIPCSGCTLNPVTNLSTDQFCLICGGNYWTSTTSGISVSGRILHGGMDQPNWQPGGFIHEGDAQLRVKYTARIVNAVTNSEYFIVDGKRFVLSNYEYRGVPDINRIVITLVETDKDG